jgi:hypothetical protein
MKSNNTLLVTLVLCTILVGNLQAAQSAQDVLQPGPENGKDIWTTSVYSYAPGGGGPGGGLDNEWLLVGGWGDSYYTLIQFDLTGMPAIATSARVEFFVGQSTGTGNTGMYLYRITEFWDWKTQGTGADNERLWWADRPNATQWNPDTLSAPTVGEWYSIDITTLYNSWQDNTYENYGIQLRPTETWNKWNEFYSSDYIGDPSLRPRLVIQSLAVPSYISAADFDKDGDIDAADLAKFGSVYGSSLNRTPFNSPWSWDSIPRGYFCDNWEPNDTDPDRSCTIRRPDYSSTYARISNLKNGQAQLVAGTIDETFMEATSSGALQFTTGEVLISNMFDSEWADVLGVNEHFNTVWNPTNISGDNFEVISQPDERSAPSTTMNRDAYFFSYDESNISLKNWVDYLEFVKLNFKKSIDTLVIYAHGNIGSLWITSTELSTSDLQTDESTRSSFKRLRNILSPNGHILLFSCNTAQDINFIRELSLLAQAYVHANSNATGFPEDEAPWFNCASNEECTDWQLDLVCDPNGDCHYE